MTSANEHRRVLIIEERGHGFPLAAALAAATTLMSGHVGQLVQEHLPVPYELPKTFKARRRGPAKGILQMMIDLGAQSAPPQEGI